ncbi:hypothetical protein [Companilactobacillus heilongjiangensis]|nr:hypothetical protein [Companilactobacillus heilongjiangensis]
MNKRLIMTGIAALALFAVFTTYYVSNVRSKKIVNEEVISKHKVKQPKEFIDKRTAEQVNRKFYSHEKIQAGAQMDFVGYPSTFSKMVNSGQLTIVGQVTGSNSFVSNDLPHTIADVGVQKVLHGDSSQKNKIIRVMFLGGNIATENTSDKVVTVEYSEDRLPRAGEKIAMILSKAESGTNNIPGEFWLTQFAHKSVFFQDKDGQYRRTPEAKSIGGGTSDSNWSQNDFNAKDDKKMNDGMNKLINSKQ